jgi:hypothetical protein
MDPIKATVSKQRIGAILARIKAGESIEPEASGWTMIDCLTVAGVLLSNAMSAGAHVRSTDPGNRAGAARFLQDLQAGIEFISVVANAHANGTWDEFFEPIVTIGIRPDGRVTPLAGFKR